MVPDDWFERFREKLRGSANKANEEIKANGTMEVGKEVSINFTGTLRDPLETNEETKTSGLTSMSGSESVEKR